MKKRKFNPTEQKIMRLLFKTKVALTIGEIAKESGVTYPTAKKYVKDLLKDKLIEKVK